MGLLTRHSSLSHFTRNTSPADALVSVDAGLAGSGVADKLVMIWLPKIKLSKGAAKPFGLADSHRRSPSLSRPKTDVFTNVNDGKIEFRDSQHC